MLTSHLHVLISGNNAGAVGAIQGTQGAMQRGSRSIATAAAFAAKAVLAIGTAAAAATGAAAAMGVKGAADAEQAEISFTTMLGSAERAKAFLADLNSFAAKTPFDMPGLRTAASSLVSAGIDASKVIPIMTSLGNATSGMGTGAEGVKRATVALQQMTAAQKISGEDLNQLRDAGIPVFDLLAAATGKSTKAVAELAQAGKLGKTELDLLMGALESGKGLERFNGLMEKQSASLTGMWSTLKDTFEQGLAVQAKPLAEDLKSVLPTITEAVGSVINGLGPVFDAIGSGVKGLAPMLAPLAAQLGPMIARLLDFAGSVGEALMPILEELLPVLDEVRTALMDGLLVLLPPLSNLLLTVVRAVAPLIGQFAELAGMLIGTLAPVLAQVVDALAPVLEQLGAQLSETLTELAPHLGELAALFGDLLVSLLPILPALGTLLGSVVKVGGSILSALLPALMPLLDALVPIIELLARFAALGMEVIAFALEPIADFLLGVLIPAIDAVVGPLADLLGMFGQLGQGFSTNIPGISTPALGRVGMAATGAAAVSGATTNMGGVAINVSGAQSPEATAKAVGDQMRALVKNGNVTARQARG